MKRTPSDRRLRGSRGAVLNLLLRGDRTVTEIAEALGMTGNGVRVHVAALDRDGLIERRDSVRGVSKPSQRYGLSEAGRLVFSRAHGLMLRGLLDELRHRASAADLRDVLEGVGRRLGTAFAGGDSFRERLKAIVRAFRDLGGDPSVSREGRSVELSLHHCPLGDVVTRHPETCAFGRALVSEIARVPVEGRCSAADPPRCRFLLTAPRAAKP